MLGRIVCLYEPTAPAGDDLGGRVAVDNRLIVVHGATRTAQLVYTEYVIEKQGAPVPG